MNETQKRNKGEVKNDQRQLGNQNPNESNVKVDMGRVRSRQDIPCGSFICEYIGELLNTKEVSMSEYLF